MVCLIYWTIYIITRSRRKAVQKPGKACLDICWLLRAKLVIKSLRFSLQNLIKNNFIKSNISFQEVLTKLFQKKKKQNFYVGLLQEILVTLIFDSPERTGEAALLHLTGLAPALFLLSNFASSTLAIGSYRFDFRFHLDYDYVKRSGFGYVWLIKN